MELSRFWDQPTTYSSADFSEFWSRLITDGVYVDPETERMGLGLTMSGLTATLGEGIGYIKGRDYTNTSNKSFTLAAAHTVTGMDRIDRIVLRLDIVGQQITTVLKQGAASSQPTAPALTQESSVYEIPLWQIRVKANSSSGTLTDERQPVSSFLKIPLAEFRDDFSDWLANNTTLATDQRNAIQLQFDAWFDTTQSQIDEITEISLQAGIDANSARLDAVERDKMEDSRIHISAAEADASQMQDGDIWIRYE